MRLAFTGVTAGYTDVPAISDVDLTVEEGEFVAIIGPNGGGKSTLLKTIYRALRPNAGTVALGSSDLWLMKHRTVAQLVGVLGQEQAGGHDFTVRESAELGRYPHHGPFDRQGGVDNGIVSDALRRTNCTELADRQLSTLSGGEQQRALLARALAQQPKLLVLDEPTNHLDPEHQISVLSAIGALGITVLAALHSLDFAAQHATKIVVLDQGKIVAVGKPTEVFTPDTFRSVFAVDGSLVPDPVTGKLRVLLREPTWD